MPYSAASRLHHCLQLFSLVLTITLLARLVSHYTESVRLGKTLRREDADYGMIVCAGEGETLSELIAMVEQTRYQLQSKLRIAVMHCDELSAVSIAIMTDMIDVQVINLCSERHPQYKAMKSRLNGFFCKPLALLKSPFRHSILVDTDVIFFQKPEKLFQASGYLSTGALFFRDRCFKSELKESLTIGTGTANYAHKYLEVGAEILRHLHNTGDLKHSPIPVDLGAHNLSVNNSFWRHFATNIGFTPDHWQDSSVLLFDSLTHPRTLALINNQLSSFNLGYGDKEIFWLSATAAGEQFSFEPHTAASIGPCGAMLHYDPTHEQKQSENERDVSVRFGVGVSAVHTTTTEAATGTATGIITGAGTETGTSVSASYDVSKNALVHSSALPFYLNAEYFINVNKLKIVGDFLSAPHNILSNPSPFDERLTALHDLKEPQHTENGFYPCGHCHLAGCSTLDASGVVIRQIEQRQKMLLMLWKGMTDLNNTMTLSEYRKIRPFYTADTPTPSNSK